MISVYGGVDFRSLPYEAQVGLYLNIPRIRKTIAVGVAQGEVVAKGSGLLNTSFVDAACLLAEQVGAAEYKANIKRSVQKAKRSRRLF